MSDNGGDETDFSSSGVSDSASVSIGEAVFPVKGTTQVSTGDGFSVGAVPTPSQVNGEGGGEGEEDEWGDFEAVPPPSSSGGAVLPAAPSATEETVVVSALEETTAPSAQSEQAADDFDDFEAAPAANGSSSLPASATPPIAADSLHDGGADVASFMSAAHNGDAAAAVKPATHDAAPLIPSTTNSSSSPAASSLAAAGHDFATSPTTVSSESPVAVPLSPSSESPSSLLALPLSPSAAQAAQVGHQSVAVAAGDEQSEELYDGFPPSSSTPLPSLPDFAYTAPLASSPSSSSSLPHRPSLSELLSSSRASPSPSPAADQDIFFSSSPSPQPFPVTDTAPAAHTFASLTVDGTGVNEQVEDIAVAFLVSPGATVHTSIQLGRGAATSPAASLAAVPPPAPVAAEAPAGGEQDAEDDWGDFETVAPIAPAAAFLSPTAPPAVPPSVTPDTELRVADEAGEDDWSGFGETSTSNAVSSLSSSARSSAAQSPANHDAAASTSSSPFMSHSPLPAFPGSTSSSPLPSTFSDDFLELSGAAFTQDVKSKVETVFADVLQMAQQAALPSSLAAADPPAPPSSFSGPPCVTCGAATPVFPSSASAFSKLPPRFCLWCGKPFSIAAAAAVGPALVSLPKWKTTVAYLSIFAALSLPLPAPITPLRARNQQPTAAQQDDEDGLKPNAADDAPEEKDGDDEASGAAADKKTASRGSPTSGIALSSPSPPANGTDRQSAPSPPSREKEKERTATASKQEKAREEERERKAKADREKEARSSPSPTPSPSTASSASSASSLSSTSPASSVDRKSAKTTVVGKLSKFLPSSAAMASSISNSISSSFASISPQHSQNKAKQAAAAERAQALSAHASPASSAASSAASSPTAGASAAVAASASAGAAVDVAALVKRIQQLTATLPNLDWLHEGMPGSA